ncbi:Bug family tripartite tricarboxylate transporter substrate binding protein [Hydrogenophaga sp. T2]|uniref:Bug family tripartite tricarboxylate transporter substrate binding protein n=1 Tax=Hydrogenophaga sp. T2 TaxID=3132823 RepID=UPI003CF596C4
MKRSTFIALSCLAALAPAAFAQGSSDYPSKPVRVLVGYPPGGASDIIARLVSEELAKLNKQPFVVENRPGVGGMLALQQLTREAPDGQTLGLGVSGTLTTGPHLQKNKLYDPLTDFASVGPVAKAPMVLLAYPGYKYDTVNAVVREARAKPGEVMFASGAQAFELALQLLNTQAGIKITSVPYPGGAKASIDVMSGRVPLMVDTIGAQQENIKAGKLKALAVLDSRRSPVLPDVPTMQQSGVSGYQAVGWTSLVAPKGTPDAVVNKLNAQVQQILAMPHIRDKLLGIGFEPWPGSAKQLTETVATEYAKWGEVVRAAGMQPQ